MRSTVKVIDSQTSEKGPGRFTWDLTMSKTSEIITDARPETSSTLLTDFGEFIFTDKTNIKIIPNSDYSSTFGLHPTNATVDSKSMEVVEVEFVMHAA